MSQRLKDLIQEVPEQYQDIYGHAEFNGNSSRNCSLREKWVRNIIQTVQQKTGKKTLKVLDIGCAQGYYSLTAAELGCSVLGVDILDINIQVCDCLREEFHLDCVFQKGTIQDIIESLQGQKFDIVFLFSVIHHVCNGNGFIYARELIDRLAQIADCLLLELAVKDEPLYWNKNLPENYEEWVSNIHFFDELDYFNTHLSDFKRPFIFASNKWCYVEGKLYEINEHKKTSYSGKPIDSGRDYYFCDNRRIMVKKFRNVEDALYLEIRNEKECLQKLNDIRFAPRLISFSDRDNRILEVTEIHYGLLLWDKIKHNESIDYASIFLDVLDNLIGLERHGYYHGDLRIWNICIDDNGQAFLIDYGALMTTDEDVVAESQYGNNGVQINTKRAFISLIYDCLIGNCYPSIERYYAYNLSLYYDFDRIPSKYADFIIKYLIEEKNIKTFEEVRELYQRIIINDAGCTFSQTDLYQLLKNQSKAIYYEKAAYSSGIPRDVFNRAEEEKHRLIQEQNVRINELEARIKRMTDYLVIVAEWANKAYFKAEAGHLKPYEQRFEDRLKGGGS